MRERDIVYENGDHWVYRKPNGRLRGTFEVYRVGITRSKRCAIIGYRGSHGLNLAIMVCDRREAEPAS